MPVITPVPLSELPLDLKTAIDRNLSARVLSTPIPVQIWAHKPELASAWLNLLEQFQVTGKIEPRLRELVRLKIASITKCKACQMAKKSDEVTEEDMACLASDDDRFTPREQAALQYAELFAFDYFSIGDEVHQKLEQHFSVDCIVELHMYCAIMLAGGRMTYVQKGYPDQETLAG